MIRFTMLKTALERQAICVNAPDRNPSTYFGEKVFSHSQMKKYLSRGIFETLQRCMEKGENLTPEIADAVASGMREWAITNGADHYCHWFQPLTGGTAEKHDSFIETDMANGVIEEFSGKVLIQQEPDASSFPSGGIRNTFEARGYSAWDPTSPAFIVDTTLCIPTVFISYTGEALDYKTPLLRSIEAINKAATEVCRYFDKNVDRVITYLGWEQEYFLIDKALWYARPDLVQTGRTLMGHEAAKNQQLEDHYFGSIPERVLSFMKDLEYESLKLGIPLKTRHNEVAPNQFELAPIYEEANLANDHNQLLMTILQKVASRHNFKVLFHEKPFKGVNGSGKHNNWSLGTDTGINLLKPGKTAFENLQFMTFIINTICAVYHHNALLKASVMSATNEHRLGANEAPPAIISTFLGSQIEAVLDGMECSTDDEDIRFDAKNIMKMSGLSQIPTLLIDNTDRNRTSPFAFTGNRFEFRAVGSSDNCAEAMIVLNTAVAQELTEFRNKVESKIQKGSKKEKAIYNTLREMIKECRPIIFGGNGYSAEWREEAQKRGLDCRTSAPEVFAEYIEKQNVEMFSRMGVYNRIELEARAEIKWETYVKKVQIESRVLGDLAMNHIVPIASKYETILLDKIWKMKQLGMNLTLDEVLIRTIQTSTISIQRLVEQMTEQRHKANRIASMKERAAAYHDLVNAYFSQIRELIDSLEEIVDDQIWTLPKYREIFFSVR